MFLRYFLGEVGIMTEKLYNIDSYIKEFTAKVLSCEKVQNGYIIVLDKTAFFPEAGGQPSDIGFLDDAKVFDVQIKNDVLYHYTDKEIGVGQAVNGSIDFERRFDFMQQHSAEHIVSGVANRLYGCQNVGFHLSEEIVTLDFDKLLSREEILMVEELANKAVFENNKINTYYPETEKLEKLNYRSKGELEGAVRIVEIENTDMCACCAPHVKFTGEIGLIKLLSSEKLRGGVRIELKAGMRALKDYNERFSNTAKIGDMLAVKYFETADAVARLMNNISEQKALLTSLKRKITEQKVNLFNAENRISAEFEDDLEVKELQIYADALYKKAGGIRAVFSQNGEDTYTFAICGQPQELDEFFKDFKLKFNVKGGGRNGMVQGTVIAKKESITAFLRG